jgi:GMP synthase-like glutamine amidotransferase
LISSFQVKADRVRALFIKQDHNSPGGHVGDAFAELGYDITELTVVPRERYHSPDVTVSFPDPARYDAIVAFGAVWAVYDDAAIGTWIHEEIAFTRAAMAAGVPVLGICFGGQMLAAAVGGRVERAPAHEIGWTSIRTQSPGLIPSGPWFEWHFDRFELPAAVPALATTPLANQAFIVGRSLGLQFHPEVTESVLAAWLDAGGMQELASHGIDAEQLLAQTRDQEAEAGQRALQLVRGFTRQVATRPVAVPASAAIASRL